MCRWLRVRSGEGKSGSPWCRSRSSFIRRPRAAPRSSSTRCTSRPASASNMRRSCPASARSTATRSSRAMRSRRAITSCSTPRRSRASSSRAARRSTWSSSSTTTSIDPMYFDKPYYVVPADDLAEEAYVVLRDALSAANKIGIGQLAMRGQEYVVALKPLRPRPAAGDAALCRRGQQEPRASSATSATTSPMPTCSTWPRC